MIWQIIKNLFKNHKTIWISRSLAAFGSVFLMDEVLMKSGILPDDEKYHFNFIILLLASCILYGLIYTVRRIISYTIKLPSGGNVLIEFDDLFKADTDYIFISVNNFFDYEIGNTASSIISKRSLLGQYIIKAQKQESIKEEISEKLSQLEIRGEDIYRKQHQLPFRRYKNGTCVILEPSGDIRAKAILVVSSFTDFINNQPFSNSTIPLVTEAICSCLDKIPEQKSISFPLVGSGYSRISLETNQLLQVLIGCIIERSQKLRRPSATRIVLQPKFKGELPLYYLKKEWTIKK